MNIAGIIGIGIGIVVIALTVLAFFVGKSYGYDDGYRDGSRK